MKKILLIGLVILGMTSCEKDDKQDPTPNKQKIGCVCKDGTRSNATGSGACSGHGGVDYWLYK